jgi:hypothetical protein
MPIPSAKLRTLALSSGVIELYEVAYKSNPIVRFANLEETGSTIVYRGFTYTCAKEHSNGKHGKSFGIGTGIQTA